MTGVRRLFVILLSLLALTFGFSMSIKAQADCVYGYRIYIRDREGKAVENARHEVSALGRKDRSIPKIRTYFSEGAYYVIVSMYGTTLTGDFLLRVSAEGFETYERQFQFPVCEIQGFELKLQPKGSAAKAVFERLLTVHGKVFDEEMKPFGNAKVEATSADGHVRQTSSNAFGFYQIDLPKGVATIRVTDGRIPEVVFENFKVEKNYSVLNVPVCLKCKQSESKN